MSETEERDSWAPVDLGPVLEEISDPEYVAPECSAARYCCAPGACMTAGRASG